MFLSTKSLVESKLSHRLSIFCFTRKGSCSLNSLYDKIEPDKVIQSVRYNGISKGVNVKTWKRNWLAICISLKLFGTRISIRAYQNGTVQWTSGLTDDSSLALEYCNMFVPQLNLAEEVKICNKSYAFVIEDKVNVDQILTANGFRNRFPLLLIRKNPCVTYESEKITINHYVHSDCIVLSAKSRSDVVAMIERLFAPS